MAQAGYTPIQLYYSSTTTNAPSAGNLASGELAINITDGKLFYKDNGGSVQVIAWKTTPTTAGGTGLTSWTAGDLPYYATGTTLSKLGIGTNGQILTSTGTAPQWSTLSGVAVTTFSAGTTGFTPSSPTSGAVTLGGTLATTNGGTGLTSFSANQVFYASSTSAVAQSSNLQFSGTDLTVYGITVGRGAGAVSTNTAVGASALAANTTGYENVAVGSGALNANTNGYNNVSVGRNSLFVNTSGALNAALGDVALRFNTTGNFNTAVGSNALYSNTTASNNTAVGYQAGYSNMTGGFNFYAGYQTGYTNTAGFRNSLSGVYAGYYVTGNDNTAHGYLALGANTVGASGSFNTALGSNALANNTTASNNTAVGYQAGYLNTTGTNNTLIGYLAGYSVTGSGNVALGQGAAQSATNAGNYNVAIGFQAGYSNTGQDNTFVGTTAGNANTSGSFNTGVGREALNKNITASYNTAVGYQAGYNNTTSGFNAYFGYYAGQAATGVQNTFIGSGCGYAVTTGSRNTIIGQFSGNQGGLDIRTANNYIVLSDGDGNPREYIDNVGMAVFNVNRTSTTSAVALVLTDNVTGAQTNGVYKAIQSLSNAGSSKSEIRFIETDGTNNNTAIAFATASTAGGISEKMRVLNTGAILALSGATLNASGTGIGFPGTQSASTDPNVLDDYEEGTWTPILQGAGADPTGVSYVTQSGFYTKVGNLVTVNFYFAFTTFTGGSGVACVGGLPFAPKNGSWGEGALKIEEIALPSGRTYATITAFASVAYAGLYGCGSNTVWQGLLIGSEVTSSATAKYLTGTLTYLAS